MMLFKLSLKNIKKSYKDYGIYFFTLILGISIFYIFNSIESQTVMLNLTKTTNNAVSTMTKALSVISVFVSFVLAFLVIYANNFLMKRRNREFGIYMTLGMGKGNISKIILFETMIIGAISLLIGLIIGTALSQVMSIVVANLFEADMSKFRFVISYSAIIKTVSYFCIIFLVVMIFNVIQVNRCKLIDLIQGVKKSEKIRIKNPYICTVTLIFSSALLGYAYYKVTSDVSSIGTLKDVILQIVYGIIGTALLFWSLSGLLVKLVMMRKGFYYKNLNSFTLRQISSKINTTVLSMTVICLMIFLTICIFSSSVSMNSSLKEGMKKLSTVDIAILKSSNLPKVNEEEGEEYTDEEIEKSNIAINQYLEIAGFSINENLKDIVSIKTYKTKDVTLRDTLDVEDEGFDSKETLVKISDYNKIAKLYGLNTYELSENEYMIICNVKNTINMRNSGLKNKTPISIKGKEYIPKYKECKDGYIMMSSEPQNFGVILLPDKAVDETMVTSEILAANFIGSSKEEKQLIENKVSELREKLKGSKLGFSTKIDIYNANIGTSAMAIFIGLYVGIVFLISSAAILSLKELSESADSKERYRTLRKIGLDDSMINRSLFVQVAIFFAFPLILAIIHSIFGIQVSNMMLESFGRSGMLKTIVITSVFLVVIYGGYFLITYLCSKNIIKE
ncbi:putative ABC transport system permease protein [Clostridium collagenovorans DSM 3089]|uniref:Putative ABC transport system permease protein n=1 Tax=Clostridium collagenovorans DSM 3089 TaxID=1121306 RepID=A0A1M5V0N6_9CLOT|nr:ABC transporter permease [Clostridium collagenovorans]SHH68694.1 putative ABC transport system permease protein [Clostridium collagenovorans DSM 3089]